MGIQDYLDPSRCPAERPAIADMSPLTRELHESIDASIRKHRVPYLHPSGPTVQVDLLGSKRMIDWQESKAAAMFMGEECWSELPQVYGRYGVAATRELIRAVRELEHAAGAILTDCGMQACALVIDTLFTPGAHGVIARQVYNKTKKHFEWTAGRIGARFDVFDDGDLDSLEAAIQPETTLVFAETFTNPLGRALDLDRLSDLVVRWRADRAPRLRMVVDDTIATPWSLKKPLLDREGIDVVVASGTKALGGQDRDMWGYIASNRIDLLNEAMDLQATRGGMLDWRRSEALLSGLEHAESRFVSRSRTASAVAAFLGGHPLVKEVFHPSVPSHPDRAIIDAQYTHPGALLSFRVGGANEEDTRHFADVLATTVLPRYALSFDGLATKLNHHRTVSEYFAPTDELERCGWDRLVRLGIGLESAEDLIACINWALWNWEHVSAEDVETWQRERASALGI